MAFLNPLTKIRNTSKQSAAPARAAQPSKNRRKPAKVRRSLLREGIHDVPLRTTKIAAPLQFTSDGVFAWYVLGALNWEFLTLNERIRAWDLQRSRYGQVAEALDIDARRIHQRRFTMPYGSWRWAADLHHSSDPPPDVPGAENFDSYCVHAQNRLGEASMDQRATMIGVWLGPAASQQVIDELVNGTVEPSPITADLVAQLVELDQLFTEEAETGGFAARRATSADLGFLMHRSLSMGLPAPAHTGEGVKVWNQLGEFTDRSAWVTTPPESRPRSGFPETVQVVGRVDNGDLETKHVVTLAMGEMPDLTWPEQGADGWLMASDWLGIPVEWSVSGELQRGSVIEKTVQREAAHARDMKKHYAEHDKEAPPSTQRAIDSAVHIYDEITTGDAREAPRFTGTVRAAVYGDTAEEAKANARRLITHMQDTLRMPMHIVLDQVRALREFVPFEPRMRDGWTRRMSVGYLTAGMPHIDAAVGTEKGPYLGYSALSRRAVLFDPHWAMENNYPGLVSIFGEPGSGKSFFTAICAYNMFMTGKRVVVEDPSGPLGMLTRLPETAPFAAELNLARADEGTLSPPAMIPVPLRENFLNTDGVVDDFEYRQAVDRAEGERFQLSFDTLRMWLSPSLVRTPGTDQRLADAIDAMANRDVRMPQTMWNLRWALQHLEGGDQLCGQIAREIKMAARTDGRLIMPKHSDPVEYAGLDDKRLIVITMPGITAPSGGDPDLIGTSERYAIPLIHLAAFFATRSVYSRPREEPKAVMIDEGDSLVQHPSGRILVNRLGSDSRKWNTAVFFASQDPHDSMAVGQRMQSLVGAQLVFRLRNELAAVRAAEGINAAAEYASVIQKLQTGQAVFRDPTGRTAKIVIDKWHPSFELFNTTPRPKRAEYSLGLPPAPMLDPRLFEQVLAA